MSFSKFSLGAPAGSIVLEVLDDQDLGVVNN